MDNWFDALLDWLGKLICLAFVLGLIGFTIVGGAAMIVAVELFGVSFEDGTRLASGFGVLGVVVAVVIMILDVSDPRRDYGY